MTALTSGDAARPDALAKLRSPAGRLVLALPLVALGDWLLRGPSGSALLLLVLALALAAALTNPWRASPRTLIMAGAALVLGCLPMVEDVGLFPLAFALAGLAMFALLLTGEGTPGWLRRPFDIVLLYLSGPKRVIADGLAASRVVTHGQWGRYFSAAHLAGWVVPIGLLAVFAILFADANPLLARWLASLDPAIVLNRLEPGRTLLWAALLAFIWPFLQVRLAPAAWRVIAQVFVQPPSPQSLTGKGNPSPRHAEERPQAASRSTHGTSASFETPAARAPQDDEVGSLASGPQAKSAMPGAERIRLRDTLLGRAAIARSLVLFNLLFAVQTAMDAVYLWGGVALPEGMTYASYAHRGAYPLIVTALLAAGFVLAAMRRGGPAENSPLLRGLVFLFVAQNVGLVLSSILRLDLYVSVYSLTYWRVAAFVWMGLVAIGLVLIGLRIALGQTNRWLIGANLIAATVTLYACCFFNFAALIANWNVEHGQATDMPYLVSLGPASIPAIDRVILLESDPSPAYSSKYLGADSGARKSWLIRQRDRLALNHHRSISDWRAWTFRDWRLSRYLAAHPAAPQPGVSVPLPPEATRPGEPPPVEPAPSPR